MTTLATYEDKPLLVDVLSRAFENNGSVRYVAGYGDGQMNRIRALMEYSVEICFHYGNIYLDSNRTACALILYPHRKRTTLRSVMLDVQLVLRAIGWRNIRRVLKREAQLKRIQPKEDMVYLWFIGVMPDQQQAGIGSALLLKVIEIASREGLPVYLETSVKENLSWYHRFGFTVYGSLDMDHMELQLKIGDFFYAANLSFSSSISSICLGVLYPRAECVLLVL